MTNKAVVVKVASTALLFLFLVASCSQWFGGNEGLETNLQLNIDPGFASRGIGVDYFEVTALEIEVGTESGEPVEWFWWESWEGPQTHMLPVPGDGSYYIRVIHFGTNGLEEVTAEEMAWFDIRPMAITVIDVVPGSIGLIRVNGEEAEPPEPVRDCEIVGDWIARDLDFGLGFLIDGSILIGADGWIEALQFEAGTDMLIPGALRGWVTVCEGGVMVVATEEIYTPPPDGWILFQSEWRSEYLLDGDILHFSTDSDGDGMIDLTVIAHRM